MDVLDNILIANKGNIFFPSFNNGPVLLREQDKSNITRRKSVIESVPWTALMSMWLV